MSNNVSELAAALGAADLAGRSEAAEQLARRAPEAQPAAVALVRASGDDAEEVRQWAVAALEELGPPLAEDLPDLASLLTHEQADVGYWAATLLGRLGEMAASAVDALSASLSSDIPMPIRQRAAWALGKIGPPAARATAALEQAASSQDARLSRLAKRAIEQIG